MQLKRLGSIGPHVGSIWTPKHFDFSRENYCDFRKLLLLNDNIHIPRGIPEIRMRLLQKPSFCDDFKVLGVQLDPIIPE